MVKQIKQADSGHNGATTYTREQVLASKKYRAYRDVLGVMLEDGKQYTAAEIKVKRDEFLNHPIKEKINKREG